MMQIERLRKGSRASARRTVVYRSASQNPSYLLKTMGAKSSHTKSCTGCTGVTSEPQRANSCVTC